MMRTACSSLWMCALALMLGAASSAWAQRPKAPPQPAGQETAAPADADEEAAPASQPSQQAKCDAYRKAFDAVVARVGRKGLSDEFIGRNAAFIEASCAGERNVCPRSPEELRVANFIVAQAVGSTGGTFMPFGCPKQP